jgi:hypothetical protein
MTGNSESQPLQEVWAYLSVAEARELLESLKVLFEETSAGEDNSGWHTHVGVAGGPELTIALDLTEREPPVKRG